MTAVYVTDHRARIGLERNALVLVGSDRRRLRVPMNEIDTVVLASNAQISTAAMAACVDRGVRVTALRRNGAVRFSVVGGTNGNVLLRVAQVRHADDPERAAALARTIVAGKLRNSGAMLRRWASDARRTPAKRLSSLAEQVDSRVSALSRARGGDAIRGVEGDVARTYFKGMGIHLEDRIAELEFTVRSRRPPRDPVNAALGFAYGLVAGEVRGAIEAVGLDPQIGFLHGLRPGRPSLALDLVEELRPIVADRLVVRSFARRQLSRRDFMTAAGGACYFTDDGRKKFLGLYDADRDRVVHHRLLDREVRRAALPLVQAMLMARHLRGDLPTYAPYVGA